MKGDGKEGGFVPVFVGWILRHEFCSFEPIDSDASHLVDGFSVF